MYTRKTILLIEDEHILSTALELKLSSHGYDVTHADDGKTALEYIKNQTFDLILTDLVMPQVNGFKVLEYLNKNRIPTPKLVMSNLGQKHDIQKAEAIGIDGYLVKSNYSLNEIVKYVNNFFVEQKAKVAHV